MPARPAARRSSPVTLDRRHLLGASAAGLLLAALPSGPVAAGTSAEDRPLAVARQDDAAGTGPTLAERWTIPDGLPPIPEVTAASVFVGDIGSGQVLFAQDAEAERAPASTAKIFISLTLIDILTDLGQTVTIEEDDTVNITVFSNAQLQTDDQVTVEGLLYGLMLPSGNDAARALARTAGLAIDPASADPTTTFLDAVNAKAAAIGAAATVILQPAGEDTDGQHTTARDLAIGAAALLDNEILAGIVKTVAYDMSVAGPNARNVRLDNTNALLTETGIIGVKTGSTPEAGACLVTGARFSDTSRVVLVVMGSALTYDANDQITEDSRYPDTLALIGAVPDEYQWVDLTDDTVEGLAEEAAAWQVTLGQGAEIVIPRDGGGDITYQLILGPAGDSGDVVGRVLFFIGDKQIADQPVYQL